MNADNGIQVAQSDFVTVVNIRISVSYLLGALSAGCMQVPAVQAEPGESVCCQGRGTPSRQCCWLFPGLQRCTQQVSRGFGWHVLPPQVTARRSSPSTAPNNGHHALWVSKSGDVAFTK